MEHKEKISKANNLLAALKKGLSEPEAFLRLKEDKIFDREIDSIIIASKKIYFAEYGKTKGYNIEKLKDTEFKNSNPEWLNKFHTFTMKIKTEKEKAKLNEMLNQDSSKQEILSQIDLNVISEKEILNRFQNKVSMNKKVRRDGFIAIIGGLTSILFFEFTVLQGKSIYFSLIIGIAFIVIGAFKLYTTKKIKEN